MLTTFKLQADGTDYTVEGRVWPGTMGDRETPPEGTVVEIVRVTCAGVDVTGTILEATYCKLEELAAIAYEDGRP